MTFKLSARSQERLKGVDNRIFNIIEVALTITHVDFGIPNLGGLRTAADQRNLFKTGATKCDGIKIKSEHQSGLAFDVYAYVDGKASWDRYHLTQVAAAILQAAALLGYPLAWGGNWKSWQDMPHFQLED
jgi:peptidoglycan L-alanyl-D-glutamate endopeptidase CwlK